MTEWIFTFETASVFTRSSKCRMIFPSRIFLFSISGSLRFSVIPCELAVVVAADAAAPLEDFDGSGTTDSPVESSLYNLYSFFYASSSARDICFTIVCWFQKRMNEEKKSKYNRVKACESLWDPDDDEACK